MLHRLAAKEAVDGGVNPPERKAENIATLAIALHEGRTRWTGT